MDKIVLASDNQGKLREFKRLLETANFKIIPQSQFNTPEAIEDGLSFVENSIIKARNAAEHSGLPALADDSGIEVDYLNGQPGIYSARYAGVGKGDQANNDKLLASMQGVEEAQRTARFRCCIVFVRHPEDPSPLIADASWEGIILNKESGDNGFGYDSLFYVPTHQCSSAELDPDEKNKISHRGLALEIMLQQLTILSQ
ncbi:MAG: RdgB/HAM1 family non-canonical purine NTP pyrophosphatase [Thiotrichaceae bacterium]|nr:RdgB/HAM1 family non-canonical purine NTP pyrophosphatase [Thiotrichaceae bacterium]